MFVLLFNFLIIRLGFKMEEKSILPPALAAREFIEMNNHRVDFH